jgi:hypothetical protein
MHGTVADRTVNIAHGDWRRYAEVLLAGFRQPAKPAERTEAMTDPQLRESSRPNR